MSQRISNETSLRWSCDQQEITAKHPVLTAVVVVQALLAVFTVTANVTVISALVKSRRQARRDVTKRTAPKNNDITKTLMASLSVTDAVLGLVIMPLSIMEAVNNGKWYMGYGWCHFKSHVGNILCIVSVYHITCMAIDRYMAICKPLKYLLITTKVGYVMIACSWIIPVFFMILPTIKNFNQVGLEDIAQFYETKNICITIYSDYLMIINFILGMYIPLFVTYTLYFLILLNIRRYSKYKETSTPIRDEGQASVAQNKNQTVQPFSVETSENRGVGGGTPTSENPHRARRNIKAYRTIGCVLLCFTCCWLPLGVYLKYWATHGYCSTLWVWHLLMWLAYANSALNPILYCGSRSVRQIVTSFVCSASC